MNIQYKVLCTLLLVLAGEQTPEAQKPALRLTRAEIKVPMAEAGEAGLQTVLILPSTPGKHPLVLMTQSPVR